MLFCIVGVVGMGGIRTQSILYTPKFKMSSNKAESALSLFCDVRGCSSSLSDVFNEFMSVFPHV